MHMSSEPADTSILDDYSTDLAQFLWQRLNQNLSPLKSFDLPQGSAIVGGVIRDLLLNRNQQHLDLDFIVPNNAIKTTRSLAEQKGGSCIVLDQERDIGRLIIKGKTFDFAQQIGKTLEDDLFRRDFRMNAIALTFHPEPKLHDPTNGIKDILIRKIVAIRKQNLFDDPLRFLRALRLMAELHLTVDNQIIVWIQQHKNLLQATAPERIQAELNRIVKAPWADEVIPLLTSVALLRMWGNNYKTSHPKLHTLKEANSLNAEEKDIAMPLIRLTHLLSNEGLKKLRFSKKQISRCQLLRHWQDLNDGNGFENLKEPDRLRLHQDLEKDLPALILDLPVKKQIIWLQRWRDTNDVLFHPTPPIDGNTLKELLKLPSGEQLGMLINHLLHEKAFGRLNNKDETLKAARYWLTQKQTLL